MRHVFSVQWFTYGCCLDFFWLFKKPKAIWLLLEVRVLDEGW
jgi:hypothetical protein